jgi:hypothetical protein
VDKLHIKFCKHILGVKTQSPTNAVLGELGRFPLSLICKERALKFWLKIMNNPNSVISNSYTDQRENIQGDCWANKIKTAITDLGFPYILDNFQTEHNYYPIIKRRIRDQFIQTWNASINNTSKLEYYCQFKKSFGYEQYLDVVKNDTLRKHLTCFRMSSHRLEIEVGRFNGIPRQDRLCKLCDQTVPESEYHFMMTCPLYSDLRKIFFKQQSWPTKYKFYAMMSSDNKNVIINCAKFIKHAMDLRSSTLEVM